MEKYIYLNALAVVSTGLFNACMMSTWAYPSAALPQMTALHSPLKLTLDQASWFATIPMIMCIPGSFLGGVLCERLGPRRMLLLLAPILGLSSAALALASWPFLHEEGFAEIMLLVVRGIQGAVVAVMNPVIMIFPYEISAAAYRGTTACFMDICGALGFLMSYVLGCSLHWSSVAWLLPTIFLLPGIIGMVLIPESPMWLARKGYEIKAAKVMHKLRGSEEEVIEELRVIKESTKDELTYIDSLHLVAKRPNLLATLVSCAILLLKELSGISAIIVYVVEIFDISGVGLTPCWSTNIVGILRIICGSTTFYLVNRLPKKPFMIVGNILLGVANASLGLFFYLQNSGMDVAWLYWLPLFGLVMHTLGYTGAIGPVSWAMSVEILPGSVRSLGFGISYTWYSVGCFLITKTFTDLQFLIGIHGIFWFYSATSLVFILLVVYWVPETRGRSLRDIEEYWRSVSKKKKKQLEP